VSTIPKTQVNTDADLSDRIKASSRESPVDTRLKTDQRVLARVTDGIYRQPESAIRELVSNAYDADATQVIIKTDRPRFETITIEDDGRGMAPDALAYMLKHIGGSAKRSVRGSRLGIANPDDPMLSPKGRRLIGKIGIGLFSVSQLTNRFHIVTKTAGDNWLTVASVVMRQYSEEVSPELAEAEEREAGLVKIWREPASSLEAHGTTLTLTNIRPNTRNTLRSADLWANIDADPSLGSEGMRAIEPPKFHIGRVKEGDPSSLEGHENHYDRLPWTPEDDSDSAFRKLVDAVWQQVEGTSMNPKLDDIFDYYLRMVWRLSLAIPVPYVFESPFEMAISDQMYLYEMPKNLKAAAKRFDLGNGETIVATRSIGEGARDGGDFAVFVDELRLTRPIKFSGLPTTAHAIRKPLLFVGSCSEDFPDVPHEVSGGSLKFEAYLIWTPKIAPTEHRGVLVRVHGSSGTLFDPTFMHYQVSEQTRLKQITCEVFVSQGFEAALNIDRESFNFAHPHVVYLTRWLHAALRRVATEQKRIASEIRDEHRIAAAAKTEATMSGIVRKAWQEEADDLGAEPPLVVFGQGGPESEIEDSSTYQFRRAPIFGQETVGNKTIATPRIERQMQALVQLLAAFGVLESLSEQQQERLLSRILQILQVTV